MPRPPVLPGFLARLLGTLMPATLLVSALLGVTPPRDARDLAGGWLFHTGDLPEAPTAWPAGAAWVAVTLPHTWNALDGADGGDNYHRGPAWYVHRFTPSPDWTGKRVYLEFDGVNRVATVFMNGHRLGEHVGGYARFRFDLTAVLRPAAENLLAVRVDNADDGTPPISADYTFFGGIYRGARLVAVAPLHIDLEDHGASGVYVTPANITAEHADLAVRIGLRNDFPADQDTAVRVAVHDAVGNLVASGETRMNAPAATTSVASLTLGLHRPRLWQGRADPHLYTATVSLVAAGRLLDEVRQRFGVRTFSIDPARGFFLNGRHLDLHGVNRHQDRAAKGWALTEADEREDFALLEELGATALRVAHYPQSPLWFDLADERGLAVWAEIPVVNEVPATERYTENARQQLRELIRQNHHRPSIFFWGVGNETREVGDRPGNETRDAPTADRLIADLARLAREEDPTRLSVYASHHRPEDIRNFHTDVLAFNKYIGWYGGRPEHFAAWLDGVREKFPTLRIGLSEYGAGASIHQHETAPEPPKPGGPWHPEEYQTHFHETYWLALRERPFVWGKFIWNLADFAADQRAEGDLPGINDKGLVTHDRRIRKDAFHFYRAQWRDEPMIHLTGRRFTERPAGPQVFTAYATADRAEFFLNGASLGEIPGANRIFRWSADLAPGTHRVRVRAGDLADEYTFTVLPAKKP